MNKKLIKIKFPIINDSQILLAAELLKYQLNNKVVDLNDLYLGTFKVENIPEEWLHDYESSRLDKWLENRSMNLKTYSKDIFNFALDTVIRDITDHQIAGTPDIFTTKKIFSIINSLREKTE